MAGEIQARLKELERDLDQKAILEEAYKFFKDITPIDQGNARRSTRKKGSDSIHANYAYATRLNKGWSNQAKDGMSQPTLEHIQKYIDSKAK